MTLGDATVCCFCNPKSDHNGMPCWGCWCETRRVVDAAQELSERIGALPARQVAEMNLNPAWFHLRGTLRDSKATKQP